MLRKHTGLCGSAALAPIAIFLFATSAGAAPQDAAPVSEPVVSVQENTIPEGDIIVTGSRIRGTAPVGSSVIAVSTEDIQQSGAVTTAQLLQEVPQIFNLGISDASRGQAGGSGNATYGTAINIRGISPFATLTLIDGHRAPPSGTTGQAFDPSAIPTIALSRVEIVADGASAIYGSDAVAGVVNLILRRDVDGVEVRGRLGFADDYKERQFSAIAGKRWSTGGFALSYEHAYRSELNGVDRDFFRADLRPFGGSDYRGTQCSPGTIVAGGVSYAIPAGGVTAANAVSLVPGTRNLCEALVTQDLLPRQSRHSAALTWQQLVGSVELSGDAYYSVRNFRQRAAQSTATLFVPVTNPFFVTPPGAAAAVAAAGGLTVNYSLLDDLGPYNTITGKIQTYGANVKAAVPLGANWRGEVQAFAGRDISEVRQFRLFGAALNNAVRSTNPATAFDPFGGGRTSPAVLASLNVNQFYPTGTNELVQLQAKADGPLFALPGGDVRVAIGAEYQHGRSVFDFISGPRTAPADRFARSTRSILAGYVELLVPLFGDSNAVSGIERLDLNVAGRVERYNDVGSTVNPKIGVSWRPFGGVTFRGSYGTSFRAPLLSDLQTATAGLFVQNYTDPRSSTGVTIGVARSGGNPDLEPEEAETYSLGVDFAPTSIPSLRASLTYFSVDYANQIAQYLSDLSILQRETQFAAIITRNPSATFIADLARQLAVTGVLPAAPTLFVDGRLRNLGRSLTQGIDLSASYTLNTISAGQFRLSASGTILTKYNVQITPTAPVVDALNTIFNPLRFRARGSIGWNSGGVSSSITLNHVGGYVNDRLAIPADVKSYSTIDLYAAYRFKGSSPWVDGLSLGFDVTNLFDRRPPFVNIAPSVNGGGGFDPTNASPIGRIVAVSLSKQW